jgi:DNA-binding Lrp family transcriptional regulator
VPKSSHEQIIRDEEEVLDLLQKNANESIDVIAKKCGFSRQKVWRIVKKLEKEKIIWGYTAICDSESLNFKHFTILAKRTMRPIEKDIASEFLTLRLESLLPEAFITIDTAEYIHGSFDWFISFYAENLIIAKRFCERLKEHYDQQIQSIELLEDIITARKQTLTNPQLKEQVKYL